MRLLALLLLLAPPAAASTEEAWETFRQQVRDACQALAGPEARVEVSPFGSETYGVALATTSAAQGGESSICVYVKATGAAELAAPLPETNPEAGGEGSAGTP